MTKLGPWTAQRTGDRFRIFADDETGNNVAFTATGEDIATAERHARLIASAPDLADALADLAGMHNGQCDRCYWQIVPGERCACGVLPDAVVRARAALAKAHTETP